MLKTALSTRYDMPRKPSLTSAVHDQRRFDKRRQTPVFMLPPACCNMMFATATNRRVRKMVRQTNANVASIVVTTGIAAANTLLRQD